MIELAPVMNVVIAKGSDWRLRLRVRDGAVEPVRVAQAAAAGATSIAIHALVDPLDNGDKLVFGKNNIVTLSSAAVAGAVTLNVSALATPLQVGNLGYKVKNVTGLAYVAEVLVSPGDATPAISLTGDVSVDPTGGIVDIVGQPSHTSNLTIQKYFWTVWRTDSGQKRPIVTGDFELVEAGQL